MVDKDGEGGGETSIGDSPIRDPDRLFSGLMGDSADD